MEIKGKVEFLGEYTGETIAVLHFGKNNRVILTPTLRQVTSTAIFAPLGIDFEGLDIIVLKSRVHFRSGYHETGIATARRTAAYTALLRPGRDHPAMAKATRVCKVPLKLMSRG